MNDKRFEAWWTSNPARVALNPAAKEVARGIWRAAQRDMATELLEINPASAGVSFDALIQGVQTVPPENNYERCRDSAVSTLRRLGYAWRSGGWALINGAPGRHANQEYRQCE